MKPTEIEHFEKVGYVMSGSRHKKVEPVRVRKENQVCALIILGSLN